MRKRLLCTLLVLCMLVGVLPAGALAADETAAVPLPFADVADTAWYADSVREVYESGLMGGISDTQFDPDGTLTRAMFVTILGRMAYAEGDGNTAFADVAADDYYAPYVAWAAEMGIVTGYSDGLFHPDEPVTREQIAAMLARYVDAAGLTLAETADAPASFRDADQVAAYAQDGLELMRRTGILEGDTNGDFQPQGQTTRAQAAAVFARLSAAIATAQSADGEETEEAEAAQTTSGSTGSSGSAASGSNSGGSSSGSGNSGNSGSSSGSSGDTGDTGSTGGSTDDSGSDAPAVETVEGSNSDEYSIAALDVENGTVTATVNAAGACTLEVTFYAEDGSETVGPISADVNTAQDMGAVSFDVTAALPEYFLVSAILTDSEGNALSDTFTCSFYTEAYQAFFALSVDDEQFEDDITMDYGDGNFSVLTEGSKQETGAYEVEGEAGDEAYTFEPNDTIAVGDILLLTGNTDNNELPVLLKVGTVTANADGSVTVTADDNAALSDFYQVLRIDATFGAVEETSEPSAQAASLEDDADVLPGDSNSADTTETTNNTTDEDGTVTMVMSAEYRDAASEGDPLEIQTEGTHLIISGSYSKPISLEGELSPSGVGFGVKASGTCATKITMYYDVALFGEDYFYEETGTTMELTADFSITGAVDDDMVVKAMGGTADDDLTVRLISGTIATNIPGLTLRIAAEIGIEFDISASGVISTRYTSESGMIYETGKDTQTYKSQERTDSVSLQGKAEFIVSPQLEFSAHILENVVSAGLYIGAKVKVVGELNSNLGASHVTSKGSYHACQTCIDADATMFLGVTGELEFRLTDKYSAELELQILGYNFPASSYYISVINDENSVFGGNITVGEGECINYVYLVTIETADENGETKTGIPLTITRANGTVAGTGSSDYAIFLYPGEYTVTADFGDGDTVTKTFTVSDSAKTVLVQQSAAKFSGKVTDESDGDPIANATVTVSNGDDIASATTDADGKFLIENLKPGTYNVTVTASKYKAETDTITLSDGQEKTRSYALEADEQVGTIYGSVIDKETRETLSDVTITATSTEGQSYTATWSDSSFKFESIPFGTYTLTFSKSNYQTVTNNVELSSSNKIEYCYYTEMQKVNTGILNCTVTNTSGTKISSATISISGDDYNDTITTSNGTCTVTLPAGTYTVAASADKYATQSVQVTITNGESTDQDFALEVVSTGLARITVKGEGYIPEQDSTWSGYVEGATVTLKQVGSDVSIEATTDANGSTGTVRDVPTGTYDVTVEATGFITATTTLTVTKATAVASTATVTLEMEGDNIDLTTGKWGWEYASNVLTISGKGQTDDYGERNLTRPWATYKKSYVKAIQKVVVEEGITILGKMTFGSKWWAENGTNGNETFLYHRNLAEVELPSTLVVIRSECFYLCPIQSINLPDGLKYIGDYALCYLKMSSIYIPASVAYIGENALPSSVTIYYGGTKEDAENWDLDLTNMTVHYEYTRDDAETAIAAEEAATDTE